MKLSTQEQNLVNIYHSGTRTATVCQLREALPDMDAEAISLAEPLIDTLEQMSDRSFAALFSEGVSH